MASIPAMQIPREKEGVAAAHALLYVRGGPETATGDPDLTRLVTAWPGLPAAVKASILALLPAPGPGDLAADLDAAFDSVDKANGSHNFASLVDVRAALAGHGRAAVDAELQRQRVAGKYSLSAVEGRHGLTSAERDAAIAEDGALLVFLSRRQ
jgi:hypothetical protein